MKLWTTPNCWLRPSAVERLKNVDLEDIRSIAVIKHGALGDMVLTRPMLITLRRQFPKARLTLSLVSQYMAGAPTDLVDRVHVAIGNDRKAPFAEVKSSFKALGEHDIIFDISATTRSFWVSLLNPARLKIGFIHRIWHRMLYDVAIPRSHFRFEAETFLEQLHVLGIGYDWPLPFGYPAVPDQRERPYIVYFPTASVDYKCWSPDHFAELLRQMAGEFPGHEHILLSGIADWEKARCDEIANAVGEVATITREEGGEHTPELLAGAELVVANDTGIRNLAIATETPTVGIFLLVPFAFGYWPRFGCHSVVYRPDGSAPPVADVAEAIRCHLTST